MPKKLNSDLKEKKQQKMKLLIRKKVNTERDKTATAWRGRGTI
jgi:hypothetical protein